MNNVIASIKKFLSNKNTVTIIGVLAGIIVLYVGYHWRVNQATTPISLPVAKTTLESRHTITADDITYIEIPSSSVSKMTNLIKSSTSLIGYQVTYGVTIPVNSFFYSDVIVDPSEQPDSAFADIPDGYTMYSLSVTLSSTYGNSIYPGNYIDLYFKATENSKIIFGKLIESIKVSAVKDSSGNHVFEVANSSKTPAVLLFAVPDDMFDLLKKAEYISGVDIMPVPRNASYSANPGETQVASTYIQEYILAQTVILPTTTTTTSSTTSSDDDE